MEIVLALVCLCLSVFFFYLWLRLWKAYDSLCIEYGRLWSELKQLERRNEDEIL